MSLESASLDQETHKLEGQRIFTECRTPKTFLGKKIDSKILEDLYDLLKWGPTSGNSAPARFLFLTDSEAKEALLPALSPGNIESLRSADVIAAICYDPLFFNALPKIGSQAGLKEWFAADVALSEETAFRNSTLQGGYLILAARMLGLDVLPISGFDAPMVEELFLRKQGWRVNFLAGLGYAEKQTLPNGAPLPRLPRLPFEEACEIR
ncbi:malonic semialdehyde reductase [Acetobacteraceae bacterium]|nr:malonic semialdehyde reductase [Acetobacteraceae bacterium]